MICPRCGHENIAGDDRCENCLEPFRDRDVPHARDGLQRLLMEQHVNSIATTALVAVGPEATVADALAQMKSHAVGCVLIVADDALAGIFTERDLLDVLSEGRDLGNTGVTEVMTSHPEAVEASESLRFALHKMSVGGFRHIPITEAGRAVGIVSAKDVVRLLAKEVLAGP
jgi:CBS domain-containing protein